MNKRSTRTGYLMLLPSALLILLLIVYPAVNTVYQSFFEIRTQTAALGPKFVGFANYQRAQGIRTAVRMTPCPGIFRFIISASAMPMTSSRHTETAVKIKVHHRVSQKCSS